MKLELSPSGHHGDQDDKQVQNSPSVATKHIPNLLLRGTAGCRWDTTKGWTSESLLSSSPLLGCVRWTHQILITLILFGCATF